MYISDINIAKLNTFYIADHIIAVVEERLSLSTLFLYLQDGLLAQGNQDLILKIFSKIPKMSPDGKRLQVNWKQLLAACINNQILMKGCPQNLLKKKDSVFKREGASAPIKVGPPREEQGWFVKVQ